MDECVEREKLAAESLLENESLTDGLDDSTAAVLLGWGVELARSIASRTAGMDDAQAEEVMDEPMRGLRRMLRHTSRWVQAVLDGDAETASDSLNTAIEQARLVYGENIRSLDDQTLAIQPTPVNQAPVDPPEMIERLRLALEAVPADPPSRQVNEPEKLMLLLPPGNIDAGPTTADHNTDLQLQDENTIL